LSNNNEITAVAFSKKFRELNRPVAIEEIENIRGELEEWLKAF
jgi:hypothetical protein